MKIIIAIVILALSFVNAEITLTDTTTNVDSRIGAGLQRPDNYKKSDVSISKSILTIDSVSADMQTVKPTNKQILDSLVIVVGEMSANQKAYERAEKLEEQQVREGGKHLKQAGTTQIVGIGFAGAAILMAANGSNMAIPFAIVGGILELTSMIFTTMAGSEIESAYPEPEKQKPVVKFGHTFNQ